MTKEEFIELATKCGYCNSKFAEEYAKDKDNFTEEDFITVYRKQEAYLERSKALFYNNPKYQDYYAYGDGTFSYSKCSKRFRQSAKMGNDRR